MPLKYSISQKAEFDALAEPVRALYTEKDGKWTLGVEGEAPEHTELKVKLSEFRDNNRTMHGELEQLRPLKDRFKDVDPDEYRTLKTKAADLENKGIKTPEDLQKAINAALKPVTDRLEATEKARLDAQASADRARFRELINVDAAKAGVRPQSLRHVLREAEDKFELKNDVLVPKTGTKHGTDPLKEANVVDWLQDLSKTDEYLFGESVGGGASGGNRSGVGGFRQGAKELLNPSPEEMGRHMDDIASGKTVVVRR